MTDDLQEELLKDVRRRRERHLSDGELLDIVALNIVLRNQIYHKKMKLGTRKKEARMNFTHEVARQLHRSPVVVGRAWRDFMHSRRVRVAGENGPRGENATRVPGTKKVLAMVHEFVRNERLQRRRVVARHVLDHLVDKGEMFLNRDDRKDYNSALRSVQRFLHRSGYKRGRRTFKGGYELSPQKALARDKYLIFMHAERLKPPGERRRIVYMDESYIHEHYSSKDDSLYHDDIVDVHYRAHRGARRFCFIAAILGPDLNVEPDQRGPEHEAQLMLDTVDVFQGGRKNSTKRAMSANTLSLGIVRQEKKETKDYHGMFTNTYFTEWMGLLFEALDKRGIQNALIVMDNAAYHKKMGPQWPRQSAKVAVVREALQSFGLDASGTKAVLWDRLARYKQVHGQPVVSEMASARGHTVVYTPPHHCDLQPIELVWAIVKGQVGRAHDINTNMTVTLERLCAAFRSLSPQQVQGCINKALAFEERLLEQVMATEAADGEAATDDEEDDAEGPGNGGSCDEDSEEHSESDSGEQ